MFGSTHGARAARPDHAACSGCSLCLPVCPVWHRTRDLRLTPHGRAKALQHGATLADIAPSVESCTLCGACEPVCPENIGLVDMLLKLRRALPQSTTAINLHAHMQAPSPQPNFGPARTATVLLAPATYKWRPGLLARVSGLLGGDCDECGVAVETDGGADIAFALEIGAAIPPQRIERFLAPLRLRKTIVVADGLLLRQLREWLPQKSLVSLGVALSRIGTVRQRLRAGDLYVIEPRAYHAEHAKLVTYYDDLRAATGCAMNLDLQRIAIPATALNLPQRLGEQARADSGQLRWLLKGRRVARIVVECETDRRTFERDYMIPILHLAELGDDGPLPDRVQS